jgi:PadR family transcriptional regulator
VGSFFGHGPRANRGDIRAAILALLAEAPMHGYQIIQEIGARSGGVWTPSPGSFYPTLFALTETGPATDPGARAPWEEVGVDARLIELRDGIWHVATPSARSPGRARRPR